VVQLADNYLFNLLKKYSMYIKPPFLDKEFTIKTSRSGGKGGQNVNKVSSKVQIDFAVSQSLLLSPTEKETIFLHLKIKLTNDGLLQVIAQTERTQFGNRRIALKKLYQLLNKCFIVRKKRSITKPTASSVEKRLDTKKYKSELKQMRNKNWD